MEPHTHDAEDARRGRVLNEWFNRQASDDGRPPEVGWSVQAELQDYLQLLSCLMRGDNEPSAAPAGSSTAPAGGTCLPATLGGYRIEARLGAGGMGVVFRARDPDLDRLVALKVLRPELSHDGPALARFEREAKVAARLHHANIVAVHAIGREHNLPFIVMEYVNGPSLAELLRARGLLPADDARRIFRELLAGLAAAHAAGLIHRDVKSSNLLLDGPEQRVKIADFGLARLSADQTQLTLAGAVLGTPEYMSPEQARGDRDVDHRSDLYSAGVVLYELLTGRTPFKADTPTATLRRILDDEPPPPRDFNPQADPVLAATALQLMTKERGGRPASAADVRRALDDGRGFVQRRRPQRKRRSWAAGLLVAAGAALIVLGARVTWPSPPITSVRVDPDTGRALQVRRGNDTVWTTLVRRPDDTTCFAAAQLLDVDGRGDVWVAAGLAKPSNDEGLVAFDERGKRRWGLALSLGGLWTQDVDPRDPWSCKALAAADLDERPGDELIVAARHYALYPAHVTVVDARNGGARATFWHPGHISAVQVVPDYFAPGRRAIVAYGCSNRPQVFPPRQPSDPSPQPRFGVVPVLFVLDPAGLPAPGPPSDGDTWSLPPSGLRAYSFLDMPYTGHARRVGVDGAAEPVSEAEHAALDALVLLSGPAADGAGLRLKVEARRGLVPGGAVLVLDAGLRLLQAEPMSPDMWTAEQWRQRWLTWDTDGQATARE